MSRTKTEILSKEERKQRILLCALRTFFSKGYAGTEISDVAREAQCSQGLIYYYFKNKRDLFDSVISEGSQFVSKLEDSLLKDMRLRPIEKLRYDTQVLLDAIAHDNAAIRYMQFLNNLNVVVSSEEEWFKDIRPQGPDSFATIRDVFDKGIAMGDFVAGDSNVYTSVYVALVMGLSQQRELCMRSSCAPYVAPSVDMIVQMFAKKR